MSNLTFAELKALIEMKKKHPKEYEEFLSGMKDILKDVAVITIEIAGEMEKSI